MAKKKIDNDPPLGYNFEKAFFQGLANDINLLTHNYGELNETISTVRLDLNGLKTQVNHVENTQRVCNIAQVDEETKPLRILLSGKKGFYSLMAVLIALLLSQIYSFINPPKTQTLSREKIEEVIRDHFLPNNIIIPDSVYLDGDEINYTGINLVTNK